MAAGESRQDLAFGEILFQAQQKGICYANEISLQGSKAQSISSRISAVPWNLTMTREPRAVTVLLQTCCISFVGQLNV